MKKAVIKTIMVALSAALCIAPVKAEAAPTVAAPCQRRSGEELFKGLFLGVGPSRGLMRQIASDREIEAVKQRKSRLTAAQVRRLLHRQHGKLQREGHAKDAKLVKEALEHLDRHGARTDSRKFDKAFASPTRSKRQKAARGVVRMIERSDPRFFDRFAADIQSGNPVRVDRALRAGLRRNMDALAVLGGRGTPSADGDPGHGVDQDSSVVLWLGVVLVLFVWLAIPLTSQTLTGYSHDRNVAKLATSLRCAGGR